MSLFVHQIRPKLLPLESRNSHIVHVLPRQQSNSFQNQFYCPFYQFYQKQFSELAQTQSANRRRHLFVYGDSADSIRFMDNLVLPSGRSICIILFSLLNRIVLTYYYGELNCDRLHILITFICIITPLLTSTHKPVLAWDPPSTS